MISLDIDGVLYLPNFSNKEQQEEFKKVFAYSLNLDKVDNKDWKINIDKCKSGYVVKFLYDSKMLGAWVVFDIPFQKIDLELLRSLNEKAEKIFREEWFYGVKDREALEALLARVDNGFLDLNHTPLQFLKLKFFGIR